MNPSERPGEKFLVFLKKGIDFLGEVCYTIAKMREAKASPIK